ncbi:MAG: tRNA lysidine(34) synthetase TilS [Sulfitobacter sp.]
MLSNLPKHVSEAFLPHPPDIMGVAVSGGSDSMALLHLLREFCELHNIQLHAVTVNHCLRENSQQEADIVADQCSKMGVAHDTLVWQDWNGKGNLQSQARDARYSQMATWAQQYGINTIAVGHTADDQAETVLMRLSRRSGVDGLAGMNPRSVREGITWVRPLLSTRRETLQSYLKEREISWLDDPSNDEDRYDRVKARKALKVLSDLGIDADVLSEVAGHLSEARRALDWQTFLAAKQVIKIQAGAVVMNETALRLQPDEIQRRLMVRSINWISGSSYVPRRGAVANMLRALQNGQAGTLDGCHVRRIAADIWIFREHNAVADALASTNEVWDQRWQMVPNRTKQHNDALTVRALGFDGLEQCPDWRATGRPHVVLQSTPSIWLGDELISAPLAGFEESWQAELTSGEGAFFAALISH